jgi:hypothetical protein
MLKAIEVSNRRVTVDNWTRDAVSSGGNTG